MSEYLDYIADVQDVQSVVNDLALNMYQQGRADREQELEKAFKKLYGSECSWSEVLLLADKQ